MTAAAAPDSKDLAPLIKKLRSQYAQHAHPPADAAPILPPIDVAEPVLGEFLRAFLAWECTTARGAIALKRIEDNVVDFNELRICLPDELVHLMGADYPRVEERSLRLRAALNEVYLRQHSVTLEHLRDMPVKDARAFLDSLDGVPRYVSSRVVLLSLSGHAAPIDGRICRRLTEARVIDPEASPDQAAVSIEKRIRPDDMAECYRLLQAWADDAPPPAPEPPSRTAATRPGLKREPRPSPAAPPEKPRRKPASKDKPSARKKSDS